LTTESEETRRSELIELFQAVTQRAGAIDPDLASMLATGLSLGALTDVIAHAMGLPPALKQAFLADCCVNRRAAGLIEILSQVSDRQTMTGMLLRQYPPTFSPN
jgi:uncharacterized protein